MSCPSDTISRTRRTVILVGLECTPGTLRNIASPMDFTHKELEQMPIYENFNPLQAEFSVINLNRAKNNLGPDGAGIGNGKFRFTGTVYCVGSSVKNIPAPWTKLMRISGWQETRYILSKSPAPDVTGVTATAGASSPSSFLDAGDYKYRISVVKTYDGTMQETKLSPAIECNGVTLGQKVTLDWSGSSDTDLTDDTVTKRIYRTHDDESEEYFFVAETTDDTSYVDVSGDNDLADPMPTPDGSLDSGATAPALTSITFTPATSGGAMSAGTYLYKISKVKTVSSVLQESLLSAASSGVVVVGTGNDDKVDIDWSGSADADLTSASIMKRIYRTKANGSVYYFVGQTLSASTFADTLNDNEVVELAPTLTDTEQNHVEWLPVAEDHDSATIFNYLDSRRYPASGCRGTIAFAGDAGQLFEGSVDIQGVYNTSTEVANPAITSTATIPPRLCNIGLTITPQGVAARTPVVKSVGINFGANPTERMDANDPDCIKEIGHFGEFDPHWTVTVEIDPTIDWIDEFDNATKYKLVMTVAPDDAADGESIRFTSEGDGTTYGAQMLTPPEFVDVNSIRCFALDFQLTDVDVTNSSVSNFLKVEQI